MSGEGWTGKRGVRKDWVGGMSLEGWDRIEMSREG